MSWRKGFAVATLLALGIAACAGDDDDAGDASGGIIRFVQPSEPATMNPVKSSIGDAAIWGSVFDRLIFVDDELALTHDGLITDWEVVDIAWRLTLREGVEFHNGEPWNADALKFTLDEYRNDPESIMAGFMAGVTDVVVVDEYTVDVVNEAPNSAIPVLMATLYGLPPGYYTEAGETKFAAAPMGTGPFVFDSYSPGTKVRVTANENYWRGRPPLDGLEFSWAGDEATRAALLESGDADVVDALSVRTAARLADSDELEIVTIQTLNGLPIFLVDSKPPFDDPLVREAAARAIDRDVVVETVFEGTGATATTGILAPLSPDVEPPPSVFDPDRSREIIESLDEAPVIPFHYQVGRTIGDRDVAEVIVGMLEEVGFEVERDPQEYANLVGAVIKGEENGMFDLSTRPAYLHPDVFANALLSPTLSLTKSCLSEPRLDELRAAGVATLDAAKAGEIYSEMDFVATNEVFCLVPTYVENRSYGMNSALHGFTVRTDSIPDWFYASF
jgi:peptide/nickel transport system substrate-binding protein